jgi:hypothetical protein
MAMKRLITLLILSLLSIMMCSFSISEQWEAVKELIDDAGKRQVPILYIPSANFTDHILIAPDHAPVALQHNINRYVESSIISNSGILTEFLIVDADLYAHQVLEMDLLTMETNYFPSEDFEYSPLLFEQIPLFKRAVFSKIESDHFTIVDLTQMDELTFNFQTEPPWQTMTAKQKSKTEYFSVISDNLQVAIFCIPDMEDYVAVGWHYWLYNIGKGTWSKVENDYNTPFLSISVDGGIIAFYDHAWDKRLNQTIFLDTSSFNIIHELPKSDSIWISERWVIRHSGDKFSIIDMQDDWKETCFDVSAPFAYGSSVFIPPPGGVKEMLEMRESKK